MKTKAHYKRTAAKLKKYQAKMAEYAVSTQKAHEGPRKVGPPIVFPAFILIS